MSLNKNKTLLANTLGNILEWYDFTLYGAMAPIIAQLFFPSKNILVSLILTFSAFAAGFLMRPLGGIIYGHIGDRFGRRKALLSSIVLMTIPTVLLGFLPTYATIGVLAPLIVTLLRLTQGLAVGGEFTGTIAYLVETAPQRRRGFVGSFSMIGVLSGILLGAAIVTVMTHSTSHESLIAWGWRIPFILAALLGFTVWFLRRHITESPAYQQTQTQRKISQNPIEICFKHHKIKLLQAFGITILNAFAFYIIMIYTTTYFNRIIGYSMEKSIALNLYLVAFTLLLLPFAGLLSDRIGRKKVLGASAIGFILVGYPLDLFFLSNPSLPLFLLGQALICILLAMYLGPLPTILAETIPTNIRYTGLSIAYNTALALFGGTTPLLVTYFIEQTNVLTIPGILLTLSAVISLGAILSCRETAFKPLR